MYYDKWYNFYFKKQTWLLGTLVISYGLLEAVVISNWWL